jgi:hypothetical protein
VWCVCWCAGGCTWRSSGKSGRCATPIGEKRAPARPQSEIVAQPSRRYRARSGACAQRSAQKSTRLPTPAARAAAGCTAGEKFEGVTGVACVIGQPASCVIGQPASCVIGQPASCVIGQPASCVIGQPAFKVMTSHAVRPRRGVGAGGDLHAGGGGVDAELQRDARHGRRVGVLVGRRVAGEEEAKGCEPHADLCGNAGGGVSALGLMRPGRGGCRCGRSYDMAGQNWHLGKTAGALSCLSASRTRPGRRLLSKK